MMLLQMDTYTVKMTSSDQALPRTSFEWIQEGETRHSCFPDKVRFYSLLLHALLEPWCCHKIHGAWAKGRQLEALTCGGRQLLGKPLGQPGPEADLAVGPEPAGNDRCWDDDLGWTGSGGVEGAPGKHLWQSVVHLWLGPHPHLGPHCEPLLEGLHSGGWTLWVVGLCQAWPQQTGGHHCEAFCLGCCAAAAAAAADQIWLQQ